jgi:hypothetical protein
MTISRPSVVLVAMIGALVVAGCGSSAAIGPSSASLARVFDSLYVVDSTAGHAAEPRALLENYLAFFADEGLTPVPVQVNTDSGTLPMLMMAAVSYDTTAGGAPADSLAIVAGWTSDYSRYVLLITAAFVPDRQRVNRIRVTSERLQALASMFRGKGQRTHAETDIGDLQALAIVVQGQNIGFADSATGNIAWAGTGRCVWQHVPVSRYAADSTFGCSRVGVSIDVAMHFPAATGIDASLTHMGFPSRVIPAVRLVGFDGF